MKKFQYSVKGATKMLLLFAMLLQMVACGDKNSLSDSSVSEIIEKNILTELFNPGIPLGKVRFMNGFEAGLGGGEKIKEKKYDPRRLKVAKMLAQAGLMRVVDQTSVFDMMNPSYSIFITPKGEQSVVRKDGDLVYFDIISVKVERVVSNTLKTDDGSNEKSDNPEPKRLVMAEYSITPTKFAITTFGPAEGQSKGRIRALLKYDIFDKTWKVVSYDLDDGQGNWLSENVGV